MDLFLSNLRVASKVSSSNMNSGGSWVFDLKIEDFLLQQKLDFAFKIWVNLQMVFLDWKNVKLKKGPVWFLENILFSLYDFINTFKKSFS